jgi:hypothetical protein
LICIKKFKILICVKFLVVGSQSADGFGSHPEKGCHLFEGNPFGKFRIAGDEEFKSVLRGGLAHGKQSLFAE